MNTSAINLKPPANVPSDDSGRPQIYFDYAASTPCDPAVAELMYKIATDDFAIPASPHKSGIRAERLIETARSQIADAVAGYPEEIVFTSGATESNNLAILGVARAAKLRGDRRNRILTIGIEHASVLGPCEMLQQEGYRTTILPVESDGKLNADVLRENLDDDVLLVSIQVANNEIGTIQSVEELASQAHAAGSIVHSDAAQAIGKIPIDVNKLGIDLMSLSAHKCYGPKGVGALWIDSSVGKDVLAPTYFGGEQERGFRPGTANTHGIAGFGMAVELAYQYLEDNYQKSERLRNLFETEVTKTKPTLKINGAIDSRLPNLTSITIEGVDAEALRNQLQFFDLSSSSACHSRTIQTSHVLQAIGLTADQAKSTLRISLGKRIKEREIRNFVNSLSNYLFSLQSLHLNQK